MAGYENLLTYTQCEEIYDLTVEFCQKFLPGRENLRQREQMEQVFDSEGRALRLRLEEQPVRVNNVLPKVLRKRLLLKDISRCWGLAVVR